MRIEPKYPPRVYFCGKENGVLVKDVGTVHLELDDQFQFANKLCQLNIKLHHWGYKLLLEPKCDGNIVLSGTSWRRSHLMFYATSKTESFNKYQAKEDHKIFWSKIVQRFPKTYGSLEHAYKLGTNEQFTFCARQKHDFDVTAKFWGFYLTPSLFYRCKKFELYPHILRSGNKWTILMSFNRGKSFKHLTADYELTSALYRIDELLGFKRLI